MKNKKFSLKFKNYVKALKIFMEAQENHFGPYLGSEEGLIMVYNNLKRQDEIQIRQYIRDFTDLLTDNRTPDRGRYKKTQFFKELKTLDKNALLAVVNYLMFYVPE